MNRLNVYYGKYLSTDTPSNGMNYIGRREESYFRYG